MNNLKTLNVMEYLNFKKQFAFIVTIETVQEEAVRYIGRKLTDEEMCMAVKEIEFGLSFGLDIVLETAILDARDSCLPYMKGEK